MLTAPETKPLKLKHDEPVSIVAFKYNLRRYSEGLRGCPVNAEKAAFYYHMAGEAGDARGLARIGYLPVNGFGAAQASILGQPSVDIARHTSSNVFFCNCYRAPRRFTWSALPTLSAIIQRFQRIWHPRFVSTCVA